MRDMNSRSTTPAISTRSQSPLGTYADYMRLSACCNQGGRKYMEDRINIHCEFTENGQVDYLYVGIYDGHGGADASNFANQHLYQTIIKQPGFDSLQDAEVLEAIRTGFLETHNAMRKVVDVWQRTASGYTSTAGTTASVAFIRRGKLYIGHVGDSGIVMGSQNPTGDFVGTPLTVEHKPDSPEEKKRIENIGGEVMNKSGVMRVVWVRPLRGHQGPVRRSTPKEKIPFLAVARALGDLWSYNSDMDAFVVSPEPDVSVVQLDSTHRCLIFGSDGLWNVLKAQHAVDIVHSHEWKEEELNWMPSQNEGYDTNHARLIARHALMRWGSLRADNISVVTIIFGNRGVAEPTYAKRVEPDGLSIENVLTTEPTSVIKLTPSRVTAVPTKPVELVFYGLSEAAPIDRHSVFHENPANDYHRIPGYTNHERGPIFGHGGSASTSLIVSRSSVTTPTSSSYRQYSQSCNVFSVASGLSQASGGKENGAVRSSSVSSFSVTSRISDTRVSSIANIEEESDLEDESGQSTTTRIVPIDVELKVETRVKVEANGDNQESGRGSNGFVKCNSTPCKAHGVVSCCSCSLIRAPLTQWSTKEEPQHQQEHAYSAVTPKKEAVTPPVVKPASVGARRHTSNGSPPLATNFADVYKCRKLIKHRRSCPSPTTTTTTHSYNTRQSCRTVKAVTKLSPQKMTVVTRSVDGHNRRQQRRVASFNHHAAAVPQTEPPAPSARSRRRQSMVVRRSEIDEGATPRRHAPASAIDNVRQLRKSSKLGEKMRCMALF